MARMSVDFVNQLESGGYRVLEVLEQPLDGRSSSSSSICSSGARASEDLSCLISPGVDNASKSTASSTPLGHLGRSPLTPPPASAATPSSSSSMRTVQYAAAPMALSFQSSVPSRTCARGTGPHFVSSPPTEPAHSPPAPTPPSKPTRKPDGLRLLPLITTPPKAGQTLVVTGGSLAMSSTLHRCEAFYTLAHSRFTRGRDA